MPEFAVATTFTAIDRLTPFYGKSGAAATKFETMIKSSFGRAGKHVSVFNSILGGVTFGNLAAGAIRRGISEIRNFAAQGLALASNLTEVQNVVDTSFGSMSGQIDAWSKTAIGAYGLSELKAKQFAGTMGAMLKSSGLEGKQIVSMSTGLVGLAGDFASFHNIDVETAFQKIRAGITGETEPLKQLGINMSVANMQAFALAQGIKTKWAAMKQGEQAQLRYAYLMKVSKDAQGDFAKTLATSVANQKRVFSDNLPQVAASVMSAAIPLQLQYYKVLNAITSRVGEWVTANKDLIATKIDVFFDRAGKFLNDAKPAFMFVLQTIRDYGPSILKATIAFNALKYILLATAQAGVIFSKMKDVMFALQAWKSGAASFGEALKLGLNVSPVQLVVTAIAAAIGLFLLLSSKVGGAGPAFLVLGQTLMTGLLAPVNLIIDGLQFLFGLLAKIPGLGGLADVNAGIQTFQDSMNSKMTGSAGAYDFAQPYKDAREKKLERDAPNQAAIDRQDSTFSGRLEIAGASAGSTLQTKSSGPAQLRAELMGANP